MTAREFSPLEGVDLVLADLDGVIYTGPNAIPYAVDSMNLAAAETKVGYITNNASRKASTVATHLSELGLTVAPEDVVTSPQAAVILLARLVPAGSKVLVVGGAGLLEEMEKAGFVSVFSADDEPAAVIQGFSQDLAWSHLAEASYALETGIPWVATNTDWTIPLARGIAPGNGAMVAAVHNAVGRLPVVAGKPESAIFDVAVERFGSAAPLFIGDRLDTDILGANRAGITAALVLTGIDRAKQVLAADVHSRPRYIIEDLRELHVPYPQTEETINAHGAVVTRVGDAVVRRAGTVLRIEALGDGRMDLLRAGAAAIWNSGSSIHAFQVPAELYSWV
jgi:HAD superfamily hydrolase (TIGR01450 family)